MTSPRLAFPQTRAAAYCHQLRHLRSGSPFSGPRFSYLFSTSAPLRRLPLTITVENQRHATSPHEHSRLRSFATTAATRMASDDDYMAFLNRANQDPGAGRAVPQGGGTEFKAMDDGAVIPAAIQRATNDAFYVSDADEPFLPVSLAWDEGGKGLPDEVEFATLIHHPDPAGAAVEIQDPAEWDRHGQYGDIVKAVREAGKGNDVRVYRVARDDVRIEYWVVTTDGKGKGARLVGAKALAIES
ncbi:hypothetical protein F4861DRAFT_500655 [Xylaria intraflava]|nr:hypothetical protein F4861DRAFT_500655 [Xylaria intraflava]